MDEIATPHDAFFRESFGRREVAVDFLRCQLPPGLLAEIDLASLDIAKDTYVAADLRSAYSDLVYRVRHRDGPLSIYLLFEPAALLCPGHATGRGARGPRPVARDIHRRADHADLHRPLHRAGPPRG
jgi:hypothetical protein